jgi:hypothetical protein
MAFVHSPKIVTDELVLTLDAGNVKSYPGSGTTWLDKSGRGSNGTLINGPTFNSGNGGSIVFDGTDDFGIVQPGSSGIQFPGNMSMDVFFKLTSYNNEWNNIVTKWDGVAGGSNNDWHFSIKQFSSGIYRQNIYTNNNFDLFGITNVLLNQWYLCCFTLINGSLLSMYINGTLDTTHVNVSRGNASASLRISDPRSGYGLTTKGRFGL